MQVSVETISELSRKLTVQVPEEKVKEEMDARLKNLAQTVRLDGFRPGKVPQRVIRDRFSGRVRDEVYSELIQSSFYEALREHDLKPAGRPSIVPKASAVGEGISYEANFEVLPEIKLPDFGKLEIKKEVAEVEQADVNGMIDKLRQQQQIWVDKDGALEKGDKAIINFEGSVDGENFTEGKAENFEVILGSGRMIPGFEDNLIGLKKGDHHQMTIGFPEDYPEKKLAGKDTVFEIDVVNAQSGEPAELNDEFAAKFGVSEGGVDALIADVKENMGKELDQALKGRVKTAVMDELIAKTPVTLPTSLVDEEVDRLSVPYRNATQKDGKEVEIPTERLKTQGERRVALGLIMSTIIEQNDISVDKDKVREAIEDMARSYEQPDDVINWYYSNEESLAQVEQMVLEDQLVEWVLSRAKVVEDKKSFDDIMTPPADKGVQA